MEPALGNWYDPDGEGYRPPWAGLSLLDLLERFDDPSGVAGLTWAKDGHLSDGHDRRRGPARGVAAGR